MIGFALAAGVIEALLKLDMLADNIRLSIVNNLKSPSPHFMSIGKHHAWEILPVLW